MPDIATALTSEISRLSRKAVRAEIEPVKKASAQYRSHIAALKRQVAALEQQLRRATTLNGRATRPAVAGGEPARKHRYSAKRLAAHRAKLGLSAEDYGRLCGVSGQSIYKWEQERSRPRQKQLDALAAIRGMKRPEAMARLDQVQS
jgi:DNA-binding transcriptional regulator YiaG